MESLLRTINEEDHLIKVLKSLLEDIVNNRFTLYTESQLISSSKDSPNLTNQHCLDLLSEDDVILPKSLVESQQNDQKPIPDAFNFILYYAVLNKVAKDDKKKSSNSNSNLSNEEEIKKHLNDLNETIFDGQERLLPKKPYYRELGRTLYKWMSNGQFPFQFVSMTGLVETTDDTIRLKDLTPLLVQFGKDLSSSTSSDDELKKKLANILVEINLRGILTLFRVRKTTGSINKFPPSCKQLLASFNAKHSEKSPGVFLTVGARAISKHFLRSQTDKFWGDNKGSDSSKNMNAEGIVCTILKDAVWQNIHLLPHDVTIYEVRTAAGYGARWSADGLEFRGFLEPQMEDGHEKGWIH